MKLRNKKTGEIWNLINRNEGTSAVLCATNGSQTQRIESIEELTSRFEDYEEPKEFFAISPYKKEGYEVFPYDNFGHIYKLAEELGIAFKTKEDAEKAVEKLKAWKILKDAGAEFYGWRRNQTGTYELYMRWEDRIPRSYEVKKDLDLLFGGEE